MKSIIKTFILLFCFCFTHNVVGAIQNITLKKTDSLALDPDIRYGRLPNGFTYYIKNVKSITEKINMRLLVKVGHYYQNPNQLGFAHTIEHLAFDCAKDFPIDLHIDSALLNDLGMSKYDLSARTEYFTTRYRFDVPSNRLDAMNIGLQWFENISDLQLTEQAIESEKGPIRQELIFRQGDNLEEFFVKTRLNTMLLPCNNNDHTNFFEHNKKYPYSSLIDFYKQWYQPDRMGVILVGNFNDINEIERRVCDVFSSINDIKTPSNLLDNCTKKYLFSKKQFAAIERDAVKNYRGNEVKIFLYFRDSTVLQQRGNWKDLKYNLIGNILLKLINKRIKEVGNQYGVYYFASFYPSRPSSYHKISIRTRSLYEKSALHKVISVFRQLREIGLTQEEWDAIKKEQLSYLGTEKTNDIGYWIKQIENHFVYDVALPENKSKYLYHWLSELTLKDFNALYKQLIGEIPEDIGIIAPSGTSYTEKQVRGWIHEAFSDTLLPYVKPIVPKQIMSSEERSALKPKGYTYTGITSSGANTYVLSNGLRIILDTLTENKGRFYLHGFRKGGTSCFAQEDYFSAINAPSIVLNAGLGNLDKFEFGRFLKNSTSGLSFRPYIRYGESGIKGRGAINDLEKILQLIYLFVTQSDQKNIEAFDNWKMEQADSHRLHPFYSIAQEDFKVLIREFLKDSSKTPKGTRRFEGISKTGLNTAYQIHQQLFRSPSEFTFVVSGDFKKNEILPLLQRYLGNLHGSISKISCDKSMQEKGMWSKDTLYHRFSVDDIGAKYTMKSEMYSLSYIAKVDKPLNWKEQIDLEVLGALMNSKMLELRFLLNAALYSTNYLAYSNESNYYFMMFVNAKPEELEMLRTACKDMVNKVKEKSFNQERFYEVMHNTVYPRYTLQRQNSSDRRGKELYEQYQYQEPWVDATKVEEYVKSLTTEDMLKVAQKILKKEHLMEFVYGHKAEYPQL